MNSDQNRKDLSASELEARLRLAYPPTNIALAQASLILNFNTNVFMIMIYVSAPVLLRSFHLKWDIFPQNTTIQKCKSRG